MQADVKPSEVRVELPSAELEVKAAEVGVKLPEGQSSLSAGALRYRAWAQSWSSAALAARSVLPSNTLAGHKRRIPLAVVLPPPARGPGTLIPSAQRLVWAAKQPLGPTRWT